MLLFYLALVWVAGWPIALFAAFGNGRSVHARWSCPLGDTCAICARRPDEIQQWTARVRLLLEPVTPPPGPTGVSPPPTRIPSAGREYLG